MKFPARASVSFLLVACSSFAVVSQAQNKTPDTALKVTQITGLTGIKPKTGGKVTVGNGNLHFEASASKADVSAASIEDVVTGADSQRVFRGTAGTLTMFVPYGGGRFLSLFRSPLDTLTIKYRDPDGALHGAIFTMATGKADPLKKLLLAQGAHTTIPDEPASAEAKPAAAKEQKP